MKTLLGASMLEKLSRVVAERMGLHFPANRFDSLEMAFCRAAGDLGFRNPEECARWFLSAPPSRELIQSMASYLTIGETYFLRESHYLDAMEQKIIPELVRARRNGERRLRIWSAGCSTGEEAYSLAILLHGMGFTSTEWDITILATDINPHALRKAAQGIYTEWSFRGSPPRFRETFFRKTADGRFELIPVIRKLVRFSYFNLMEDPCPSLFTGTNALDVIFCRNVLMYFAPEAAERVLGRFRLCLVENGWLIVGSCETAIATAAGFAAVNLSDAILYRKGRVQGAEIRGQESGCEFNRPPIPDPGVCSAPSPQPPVPRDVVGPILPIPDPRLSPPDYGQAHALYERGAYGEAAEALAGQIAHNPRDARALALMCRIRANEGRLGEALELSERAIGADKLNAGLHYLRAVILQERGGVDEAAASLRRALYLDQGLVLAHFTLGNLALQQGRERESRRHFGHALEILDRYRPEEVLPESEGMPAGRLCEIIRGMNRRV